MAVFWGGISVKSNTILWIDAILIFVIMMLIVSINQFLLAILVGVVGVGVASIHVYKHNEQSIKLHKQNEITRIASNYDITGYDYIQFMINDASPIHTFIFCCDQEEMIYANSELDAVDIIRGSKILECSIISNDVVIQSDSTANTMIGAMIGGTVGAVVGKTLSSPAKKSISSLYIRIVQKSTRVPLITISLLQREINNSKVEAEAMKVADRVYGYLLACKYQAEQKEQ